MTDEEANELAQLRDEVRRLRVESKLYKEQCQRLCEAANEYIQTSVCHLRGRPGRQHPTMVAMRKLDGVIDRSEHIHVLVDSVVRYAR